MLRIYNSLSGKKEVFKPRVAGQIGLYVCGITVYDHCHLGHGRSMVCFDVITRFLRAEGYSLNFVRNITDIDDKIIARAAERGQSIDALTTEYIASMHRDAQALGNLPPDLEPRATSHIPEIIRLIERLIERGHAYQASNGDVCYQVASFKPYGQLSNQDTEALLSGARIDVAEDKRSPLDFVLWKKAKANEPAWPSPWGEGRPGWHIECSAMAMAHLGDGFDIHGGGLDLQFPHHENEIAQSEGATGQCYAHYWMHVGMLQVNNEKMSKSTGNFSTIAEALSTHHPEGIRYFLLSSHYRSALNYAADTLFQAGKSLMRLYQSLKGISFEDAGELSQEWLQRFNEAMRDDFNTPIALSILFELSHQLNKTRDATEARTLKHLGGILGLLQFSPEEFLQNLMSGDSQQLAKINALIAEREQARVLKNWAQSDQIRQQLLEQGVELEERPSGTSWRWLL